MRRTRIEMNLKLPVKLIKRKNWYVANCPALKVASQGDTAKDAKKNLIEALSVFLITCIEHGTLNAVLNECGFTPSQRIERKGVAGVQEPDYVNIPIHLLAPHSCQDKCPA
jgi:predicted RNase H-like HicB family nuclease